MILIRIKPSVETRPLIQDSNPVSNPAGKRCSHNRRNKELGIKNKDLNLSEIGYTGIRNGF